MKSSWRRWARAAAPFAAAVVAIAALLALRAAVTDEPLARLRVTDAGGAATTREGSWWFPRGGKYVLGFDAPADAPAAVRLVVTADGLPPARVAGRGLKTASFILPAGAHAVSFSAPPGTRLVWHPPGRRGDPEYVPPSSLAPEPPATARFSSWAGASPGDGAFALAIAAVLAAAAAWSARARLRAIVRDPDKRRALLAGLAILALALAVRLWDLGGAGQTWDEDVYWSAGRNYVTNALGLDFSQRAWVWNFEHPPVTKYLAGIGAQLADGYGPARAISALLAAGACAFLVGIGARLYTLRVGVVAGVIAALTPHLIAHGQIVGHEAPALFFWSLLVWMCLRAYDGPTPGASRPVPSVRYLALIGVVLGVAICSRFINGLAAPLIGVTLLVLAPRGQRVAVIARGLAIIPASAVITCFALWPRLWSQPFVHLGEAWAKLSKPHAPEPFLGAMTKEPWAGYFFAYLYATAPLAVLVGFAAWLGRAAVRGRREAVATAVVALWLLAPLVVVFSPVRQDGVRYVLPSLLAISLAAAAGVDGVLASIGARVVTIRRHPARATAIAGTALAVYLAIACVRIHPYYLDYYGEQVGGPASVAAHRRFEVAWWGEGLAEAIAWLDDHAADDDRVFREGCVEPSHLTWFKASLWPNETKRVAEADWILHYAPASHPCPLPPGASLAHEVSIEGAPLVRIYHVSR